MNLIAQRLRITEPGWDSYTGPLGGVMFTNGLSDDLVDATTARRLGSIIRIDMVDSGVQAGAASDLQRHAEVKAPVLPESPTYDATQAQAATKEPAKPKYTREQLEEVADKNGIAGLREIAEPMGIKGRGIAELISEILAAQGA